MVVEFAFLESRFFCLSLPTPFYPIQPSSGGSKGGRLALLYCCYLFDRRKGKGDFAKQLKDEDGFGGGDGPRIIVDQNGMGPTGGYITR